LGDAEPGGPQPQLPEQRESVYTSSEIGGRLWQGEILSNLAQVRLTLASLAADAAKVVDHVEHPLVIVLSQDCDLVQDYELRQNADRSLENILFCDIHEAEPLRTKLQERVKLGSSDWKRILQNQNERFQFLQQVAPQSDLQAEGLPKLAIDFKMYFTLPTDEVYERLRLETKRRCRLNTPYVDHLSHRFFAFQSRVGLPADHITE